MKKSKVNEELVNLFHFKEVGMKSFHSVELQYQMNNIFLREISIYAVHGHIPSGLCYPFRTLHYKCILPAQHLFCQKLTLINVSK